MVDQFPNSDIVNLPPDVNSDRGAIVGVGNNASHSNSDSQNSSDTGAEDRFTPVTTEEGKLQQLIEWLEEHVSSYSYLDERMPLGASGEELQAARDSVNNRGARFPDAIIHGSMMVLGAAVNHSSPYLAYANGTVDVQDTTVGGTLPVRIFTPDSPTGAVVVASHGGSFWMGDGILRDNAFAANMAALSARSGAIVVDVDYRLAPEYKVELASDDVAAAISAVVDDSLGLQKLGANPISVSNPVVVYGISSGGHNAVRAVDKIGADTPVALLLISPALDLRGSARDWLEALFDTCDDTAREVSPGLYAPTRALRVHVQSATRDTVVKPATEYLKKVEEAGGVVSQSEFLATHGIAMPKTQREQITDAARFILEATHTTRPLPDDPAGEYDKEAVDRRNEESWRS